MSFGTGFNKTFKEGLTIGAQNYRQDQALRADLEKEQAKQLAKAQEKIQQTEKYAQLIGVQTKKDPVTGEVSLDLPPDWQFKKPPPSLQAQLFPEIGNEFQQAYTLMDKEATVKPKKYYSKETKFDPETKQGIITGVDPETNTRVQIGVDPYYTKPEKTDSYVIEGQVTLENGQKVGKGGRRSRVVLYEDNTYGIQDLGVTSKTSNKSLDELDLEIKISELKDQSEGVKNRRNTYLKKGTSWADPQAREQYRDGINASLDKIALKYLKLGSPSAQKLGLEIFNEGKEVLTGDDPVSRQEFYNAKKQEIEQENLDGKLSHNDTIAILNFLENKYLNYIPYEDQKENEDAINFDNLQLNLD